MNETLSRVAVRQTQRTRAVRRRNRRLLGAVAVILALAVVATLGTSVYVGWDLTHPARKAVDDSPARLGLEFEDVRFSSDSDQVQLQGWYLPARNSDRTVILSHGYAGNRLEKGVPALDLAKVLVGAGYNVMMFDFRNSGRSAGSLTSVGYFEVNDLLGAIHYLKQYRPDQSRHVGLIGFSMGAVVTGMAAAREPAVEAIVMDSPFADLRSYLATNMPAWTHLPDVPFTWLILHTIPLVERVNMDAVSPLAVMPALQQPVLLIHGEADKTIPLGNSQQLLAASTSGKVSLWAVPGAGHVGARKVDKSGYDRRILAFLEQNLGR